MDVTIKVTTSESVEFEVTEALLELAVVLQSMGLDYSIELPNAVIGNGDSRVLARKPITWWEGVAELRRFLELC